MKLFRSWWRKHIIDDFPYPNVCFNCNLPDCGNCGEGGILPVKVVKIEENKETISLPSQEENSYEKGNINVNARRF